MKRIVKPGQTPQEEIDKHWFRKFNITSFLFDKQLSFVEDPSPFKVAVCSRRAGKTVACAAHLVHTAINNPDSTNLYITLSSVSGKRIIWKEFKKIIKAFKLPVKTNDAELSLTFPNESKVYIVGAHDATEIEKFRGISIKLCYIDECQSFKSYIKELIDDIIGPALIDHAGSLCLIGTPGPIPVGYFHECAVTSKDWSKHYWTFWDNPHIPITSKSTHQELFDRELRRRGVLQTDPSVQREWFGRWVLDSDSLLIKYDAKKCHYESLPIGPNNLQYNYVMGVDIGYDDADAIAILGWSDNSPNTYLVDELVTPKQGLTELVNQIQDLQKKYPVSKIVMDMGGLGKKMGEEMIRRYLIPVEAADKAKKMENVEVMNDSLRTGRFKAKDNSRFAQESYLVEIDRDKSTPDRIVVSSRFHSDIIDAVLYAFKCSPAYTWEPAPEKPKPGTKEWADQQSREMFERELEFMQQKSEYNKWLTGGYDE